MTGYLAVPAALAGDISVVVGPRLLSGVADAPGLAAHRRRWGPCPTLGAQQLVDLTRDGQVAGRGGAGFPFSRKLATAISANKKRTMVVNAAEGEPGSAKDSTLLLTVPHLVLDGATVVARALDVASVHLIIPGERPAIRPAIEAAIAEHDGGIEFVIVETSAGFVGGQARAVLELVSGRENLPVTAWEPEAISGLRGRPTLLSNAETYAQVAALCMLGAREYGRLGTRDEPGTSLLTVGGDGVTGVVLEVPFGTPMREVLSRCGYDLDAPVVIGGYHGTWMTPQMVADRLVSRADLKAAGTSLGAGVILPVRREACPVELTAQVVVYLAGQTARRCGPCFNGLPALAEACVALADGSAGQNVLSRIEQLIGLLPGRGACTHPDGTVRLVRSLLRAYPDEVAMHLVGPCGHQSAASFAPPNPSAAPRAEQGMVTL
ncbi:MAG: NADH-quinone oxidoreductase subunit I [Kineosporiaceae bacterium]|nr:NADH-quinone oxidoreductase subunit I [Kineosporiaceae bacterium]